MDLHSSTDVTSSEAISCHKTVTDEGWASNQTCPIDDITESLKKSCAPIVLQTLHRTLEEDNSVGIHLRR